MKTRIYEYQTCCYYDFPLSIGYTLLLFFGVDHTVNGRPTTVIIHLVSTIIMTKPFPMKAQKENIMEMSFECLAIRIHVSTK